jgi:hypothetical protein
MSKKVSFPVMSLAFTGILYIVGLLVITLRPFIYTALTGAVYTLAGVATTTNTTAAMLNGILDFAAAFLLLWALTSLALHPDIEDSNIKLVFAAFTVFIVLFVFAPSFAFSIGLWGSTPKFI